MATLADMPSTISPAAGDLVQVAEAQGYPKRTRSDVVLAADVPAVEFRTRVSGSAVVHLVAVIDGAAVSSTAQDKGVSDPFRTPDELAQIGHHVLDAYVAAGRPER